MFLQSFSEISGYFLLKVLKIIFNISIIISLKLKYTNYITVYRIYLLFRVRVFK